MQTQAAELVGNGAAADILSEGAPQICEMLTQVGAAEAIGEQAEEQQSMPEMMDVGVGEAQAGGVLAVAPDRPIDSLEGGFCEHAVVAETLEIEQASIGGEADLT